MAVSTVSRWVKEVLTLADIDTSLFRGYSNRSASSSTAGISGVSMQNIFSQGRWSKEPTSQKFYNKPVISTAKKIKKNKIKSESSNFEKSNKRGHYWVIWSDKFAPTRVEFLFRVLFGVGLLFRVGTPNSNVALHSLKLWRSDANLAAHVCSAQTNMVTENKSQVVKTLRKFSFSGFVEVQVQVFHRSTSLG